MDRNPVIGGPMIPPMTFEEVLEMKRTGDALRAIFSAVEKKEKLLPLPTSRFPKAVRLTLTGEEAALP